MKKKVARSKRNRHIGRINAYKAQVIKAATKRDKLGVFADSNGVMYYKAFVGIPGKCGQSVVRA